MVCPRCAPHERAARTETSRSGDYLSVGRKVLSQSGVKTLTLPLGKSIFSLMTVTRQHDQHSGHYDLRQGVASYAPIIGAFGALSVPAIILLLTVVFTVAKPLSTHNASLVTFSAGLLIVAMIASLIGSIGLAAIGAETEPTGNAPAAVMFIGVSVVVSIVNILAAFEALIAIYLPTSKTLFAVIVGTFGVVGSYFLSFAIGDSWYTGPVVNWERSLWQRDQWIKSKKKALRHSDIGGLVGITIIAPGIILRLFQVTISPTPAIINGLVGAGLALALLGTLMGNRRISHPAEGVDKGLRPWEAYSSISAAAVYVLVLMIFMP